MRRTLPQAPKRDSPGKLLLDVPPQKDCGCSRLPNPSQDWLARLEQGWLMDQRSIILTVGFGSVMINTMPVWIGDLASGAGLSDGTAGAFASLVLLSASLACLGLRDAEYISLSKVAAPICLALLALSPPSAPLLPALACCGLGIAIGALTGRVISGLDGQSDKLAAISLALSTGLVVSLIVYLILPVLTLSSLWLLTALSLGMLAVRTPQMAPSSRFQWNHITSALPVRYLPFFVMMGAYWTYLELFGARFDNAGQLPFWLLGSLVTGAIGAFLAARIPPSWQARTQAWAMVAAAVTGGCSYLAPNLALFGLTILVNGFALFVYFPLYLGTAGDKAPGAMAGYLLGFAVGGAVGSALIFSVGYTALAGAILLSGLIGLMQSGVRSHPR